MAAPSRPRWPVRRRDVPRVPARLARFAGVLTTTIRDTDRIGNATLNTNQNIAAALARLGLSEGAHFVLWATACVLVLALTVGRRAGAQRRESAGAGAHLRGHVRPGGLAGVVVAPLGVDPADADRHRGGRLPEARCRAGVVTLAARR
jgi:hypothetical protein